jgi:hypothetical protein
MSNTKMELDYIIGFRLEVLGKDGKYHQTTAELFITTPVPVTASELKKSQHFMAECSTQLSQLVKGQIIQMTIISCTQLEHLKA